MIIFFCLLSYSFSFTQVNNGKETVYQFLEGEVIDSIENEGPVKFVGPEGVEVKVENISINRYLIISNVRLRVSNFVIENTAEFSVFREKKGFFYVEKSIKIYSYNPNVYIPLISHNYYIHIELYNTVYTLNETRFSVESFDLTNATLSFIPETTKISLNNITGKMSSKVDLKGVQQICFNSVLDEISMSSTTASSIKFNVLSEFTGLSLLGGSIISGNINVESLNLAKDNISGNLVFLDNANIVSNKAELNDVEISSFENSFIFDEIYIFRNYNNLMQFLKKPNISFFSIKITGNTVFSGYFTILFNDDIPAKIKTEQTFVILNNENIEIGNIELNGTHLISYKINDFSSLKNLKSFYIINDSVQTPGLAINITTSENAENGENMFYFGAISKMKINLVINSLMDNLTIFTNNDDTLNIDTKFTKSNIEGNIEDNIEYNIEINDDNEHKIFLKQEDTSSITFSSLKNCTSFSMGNASHVTFDLIDSALKMTYNGGYPTIKSLTENIILLNINIFPIIQTYKNDEILVNLENCVLTFSDSSDSSNILQHIYNIKLSSITLLNDFTFKAALVTLDRLESNSKVTFSPRSNVKIDFLSGSGDLVIEEYANVNIYGSNLIKLTATCKNYSFISYDSNTSITSNFTESVSLTLMDNSESYYNDLSDSIKPTIYNINGPGSFYIYNATKIDYNFDFSKFTGTLLIDSTNNISNISGTNNLKSLVIVNCNFVVSENGFPDTPSLQFYNSSIEILEDMDFVDFALSESTIFSKNKTKITTNYFSFNGTAIFKNCDLNVLESIDNMTHVGNFLHSTINFASVSSLTMQSSILRMGDCNISKFFTFGSNGFEGNFNFHGKVIITKNIVYHMSKYQCFLANVEFESNITFDNEFNVPTIEYIDGENVTFTCIEGLYVNPIISDKEIYVSCAPRKQQLSSYFITNCYQSDKQNSMNCLKKDVKKFIPTKSNKANRIIVSVANLNESKYSFDGINININDLNNISYQLVVYHNSNVVINDVKDSLISNLDVRDNSVVTLHSHCLRKSNLFLADNSKVNISPRSNSKITNYFLEILNISDSILSSFSAISFDVANISTENSELENITLKVSNLSLFNQRLLMKNSTIFTTQKAKVEFSDIDISGVNGSVLEIGGNASFEGTFFIDGTLRCISPKSVLDLSKVDSNDVIELFGIQLNCTLIFANDTLGNILVGGKDSYIGSSTVFKPDDKDIAVVGSIFLQNFNKISSMRNHDAEITFENYSNIEFSLFGNGTFIFLDTNVIIEKIFETFQGRTLIIFKNGIEFKKGAILEGEHIIYGSTNNTSLNATNLISSPDEITFLDFYCEGESLVTFEAKGINIRSRYEFDNDYLFNIDKKYNNYDWRNVKLISTENLIINQTNSIINFHQNDVILNESQFSLIGGAIQNISLFEATSSNISMSRDYLGANSCIFTNTVIANTFSTFYCKIFETERVTFSGQIYLYGLKSFNSLNSRINFSFPESLYLFVLFDNDENAKFTLHLDITPLTKGITLLEDERNIYETRKLSVFETKSRSLPRVSFSNNKVNYSVNYNENDVILNILRCSHGQYYDGESCQLCKAGTYGLNGKCINCGNGEYSNDGFSECALCPIGEYSSEEGSPNCTKCGPHQITARFGATSNDECVCDVGYSGRGGECSYCFDDTLCNRPNMEFTMGNLFPDGYFAESPFEFYKCPYEPACLMGSVCADGYEGFLCAKCSKGFHHLSSKQCTKCPKYSMGLVAVIVVGFVIYFGAIVVFFYLYRRFTMILFVFFLFTQSLLIMYNIDIDWPIAFDVVMMLLEVLNLDFHQIFDCLVNDEIWAQGYLFMALNILYIALFVIFMLKGYKIFKNRVGKETTNEDTKSLDDLIRVFLKDPNQNTDTNNNNNNNNTNNIAAKVDVTKSSFFGLKVLKTLQLLIVYFFATFEIQLRWFIGAVARNNDETHSLRLFSYIRFKPNDEYKKMYALIIVNGVYIFGFMAFYSFFYLYLIFKKTIFDFFFFFRLVMNDIKYEMIHLPLLYMLKLFLMNFIVVYLNSSFLAFILLFILVTLFLMVHMAFLPFFNMYLNIIQGVNLMFELLFLVLGLLLKEKYIYSELLATTFFLALFLLMVVTIITMTVKSKFLFEINKEKEHELVDHDETIQVDRKDIMIKCHNHFASIMLGSTNDTFSISLIVEWYGRCWSLLTLRKSIEIINCTLNKDESELKTDFINLKKRIDHLFDQYKGVLYSFYTSCDEYNKHLIQEFFYIILKIPIEQNITTTLKTYDTQILPKNTPRAGPSSYSPPSPGQLLSQLSDENSKNKGADNTSNNSSSGNSSNYAVTLEYPKPSDKSKKKKKPKSSSSSLSSSSSGSLENLDEESNL